MSYTKQTWANGDVITAEKLNHIEDGIADSGGGGAFVCTGTGSPLELNKTYAEIKAALDAGKVIYLYDEQGYLCFNYLIWDEANNSYTVGFYNYTNFAYASSPNEYPIQDFD